MHRINSQLVAWTGAIGSTCVLATALGWASPVSVSMIVLIAAAVVVTEVAG